MSNMGTLTALCLGYSLYRQQQHEMTCEQARSAILLGAHVTHDPTPSPAMAARSYGATGFQQHPYYRLNDAAGQGKGERAKQTSNTVLFSLVQHSGVNWAHRESRVVKFCSFPTFPTIEGFSSSVASLILSFNAFPWCWNISMPVSGQP